MDIARGGLEERRTQTKVVEVDDLNDLEIQGLRAESCISVRCTGLCERRHSGRALRHPEIPVAYHALRVSTRT